MDGEPYTRAELEAVSGGWPTRGPLCPHCNQRIPQFVELSGEDERRVRELIRQFRRVMAIAELRAATGSPLHWAQLWVEHVGWPKPDWEKPAPCPYCEMLLRSSLAKQCRIAAGIGTTHTAPGGWERRGIRPYNRAAGGYGCVVGRAKPCHHTTAPSTAMPHPAD
jgi:hypothetical protein